jgi:AraC family transcriptional regulator
MQEDYYWWVYDAVAYIEARLETDLTLQEVADHIGYSVFHFCRSFQGITGEAVMEYVRKRRLTEAAGALLSGDQSILAIAITFGYDSQAAFTRSFKRAYGVTPGAFRRRQKPEILRGPLTKSYSLLPASKGESMKPKIVSREAVTVVGLEYVGKNEQREIPALWDIFWKRRQEVRDKTQPNVALGVCGEVREDGAFSYVAGFQVQQAKDIPEGMVVKQVPAAKYAVFTHRGPLSDVENDLDSTYAAIYREWLPASGYEQADSPDFELYDERFVFGQPQQPQSEIDIYIPIRER